MGRGWRGPRGFGGLCLALLCSGAALGFREEEPGNVTEGIPEGTRDPPGPPGQGHGDAVTTWPRVTRSGDLEVTPEGNQTRVSSGVPARYWSPVIFVVLALLVLFVTYHRTKDKVTGIRDRATSGSDSSDLGALVQPQEPIPKIPALQRERKDPETTPEHGETTCGQPRDTEFPG